MKKKIICFLLASILIFSLFPAAALAAEPVLPAGYTQVDYVESHGQEYINTGYAPTALTRSEIVFQIVEGTEKFGVFGSYASGSNDRHQIYADAADKITFGVGAGNYKTNNDADKHTAVLDNKNASVKVDGNSKASTNGSEFTGKAGTAALFLFATNQNSALCSKSKIYSVKIYDDDALVRNFVPCYDNVTGEYGFYETCIGKFYGSSSGTLTGPGTPPVPVESCTVKLSAPTAVTVNAYPGFSGGSALTADSTGTVGGIKTYTFTLGKGNYRFTASGSGYYSLTKNFVVTRDDLLAGEKLIDANPGKKAGTGWEASTIPAFADELLESDAMRISDAQMEKYAHVFTTPAFSPSKAAHEYTTHTEMENFIAGLDGAEDDMYVYTAGTTGNGLSIPLVVFTQSDLSGADTIQKAAEIVRANNKPTIQYSAQIHGNEIASGEAALAMIQALDGSYGEELLKKVNICVIPRINGDGSKSYARGNKNGADMNRDNMYMEYPEVAAVHAVYCAFLPVAAIDGHEFGHPSTSSTSGELRDVEIGTTYSANTPAGTNALATVAFPAIRDHLIENGLRPAFYDSYCNSLNYASNRGFASMTGALSFLIETPGLTVGKEHFDRRVLTQYVTAEGLFDYVAANADTVKNTVAASRAELISKGATFEEDDLFVLKHKSSGNNKVTMPTTTFSYVDGSVLSTGTVSKGWLDTPSVSRPRPTAYVIPKDAKNAADIASRLSKSGISYYEIGAGKSAYLKQYSGTDESSSLGAEKEVVFENGAYVFPMNQVGANILAISLEPGVRDADGINGKYFTRTGLLDISSLYRCEHDLVGGEIPLVGETTAQLTYTVSVPNDSYDEGDSFTADVAATADDYARIGYFQLTASVPQGLTLTNITTSLPGYVLQYNEDNATANIVLMGVTPVNITDSPTTIAQLHFTVNSSAVNDQAVDVGLSKGTYIYANDNVELDALLVSDSVTLHSTGNLWEFIDYDKYMALETGTKVAILKTDKRASGTYALDGQDMFWSEKYEGYVYIVAASETDTSLDAKLAKSANTAVEIAYNGDVDSSGKISGSDALSTSSALFKLDVNYVITVRMRLEMDVTGDKAVTAQDVTYIMRVIVGLPGTVAA